MQCARWTGLVQVRGRAIPAVPRSEGGTVDIDRNFVSVCFGALICHGRIFLDGPPRGPVVCLQTPPAGTALTIDLPITSAG